MYDLLWPLIQGGNIVSFMIYLVLIAIFCAWEQYRYFNEVMKMPIQYTLDEVPTGIVKAFVDFSKAAENTIEVFKNISPDSNKDA